MIDYVNRTALVVELERIRPQYVVLPDPKLHNRNTRCTRWNLPKFEKYIAEMEQDQILKLHSLKVWGSPPTTPIRESLQLKKVGVTKYKTSLEEKGYFEEINRETDKWEHVSVEGFNIHAFAAVQVSRRFIVDDLVSFW